MKQTIKQFALTAMSLLAAFAAFAQVTTASISGLVKDSKGEPLMGATVKATHIPSGTVYFVNTQNNGQYNISGMRIGAPYQIEASFVGFSTGKITDVALTIGEESKFDFVLNEEAISLSEVVVVGETNPAINPNRTGAQEIFTRDRMSRIPSINRSLSDFTKLTPMASGSNFAGTSYRFNNVTVDGASFNNSFGLASSLGASGIEPISLDAIEQIQVMIAPYDVRNGAFTGGGINSVTKSGNNNWTGSAYYYTKSPSTRGYIQKEDIIAVTDFFNRQYGGTFSGPILKNKLFFFVNAEFDRQEVPSSWMPRANKTSPVTGYYSAADVQTLEEITQLLKDNFNYNPGTYNVSSTPTEADKITARLDWNINQKNTLSFKYFYLKSFNTNNPSSSGAMANGRGPNSYAIPFSSAYYRTNNNFNIFIADLNTIVNSRMSNSLTVGYSRLRDYREMDGGFFPEVNIGDGTAAKNSLTTFGTEANSYGNKLDSDIYQIQDNFIINFAKHQLTIGTQSDYRTFVNGYANSYAGQWQFASLEDFKTDLTAYQAWVAAGSNPNNRPGTTATYYKQTYSMQDGGFPYANVKVLSLGFYVQDKWSLRDNLKLTLGLRLDMPIFMSDLDRNETLEGLTFQGNRKIDVSQYPSTQPLFSPRLGFNWDVFSNKKLQVRGGSGLFSGTPPYVWLSNQAGNNGILFGSTTTKDHAFDGVVDLPRPTGATLPRSSIAITDDDFKYPQLWKTNLAVDYKFGGGWIATADVLFNKDINAIYHRDINHPEMDDNTKVTKLGGVDDRPYFKDNTLNDQTYDVILMTNTSKGYSIYTTLQLQRNFTSGLFEGLYINGSYTFGKAKSVTDGSSSVASSAYKYRPAIIPDDEELGFAAGSFPQRILLQTSYRRQWGPNFASTVGLVYQMYMPFRYSYTYNGDVNGDSYSYNDLMFIPETRDQIRIVPASGDTRTADQIWNEMDAFFDQDPYLKTRRGKYSERNGGRAPYVHSLDLNIAQDIIFNQANGKKHTVRFSFDIYNFLNMLNQDWGVQKTTVLGNQQYQYLIMTDKPTAANSYTPGFTTAFDSNKKVIMDTFKDNISSSSRWTMMFGIKYIFE
ncbi:MAG: TonB-dependent receptor [Rikenellaceae bacterium]